MKYIQQSFKYSRAEIALAFHMACIGKNYGKISVRV